MEHDEAYEEDDETPNDFEVISPSGASYTLLTEQEVNYFNDIVTRYMSDNAFTNVSDLQELDRVIMMELMVWRWSNWLSTDRDYWGESVNADEIRKFIVENSKELRLVKKALGLDKTTRDKDKGSSLAEYIENLGRRAKQFGYHREEQSQSALILFNELTAMITLHKNCDETERREMHCTERDVINWIATNAIPRYQEIDQKFKMGTQRFWVKSI